MWVEAPLYNAIPYSHTAENGSMTHWRTGISCNVSPEGLCIAPMPRILLYHFCITWYPSSVAASVKQSVFSPKTTCSICSQSLMATVMGLCPEKTLPLRQVRDKVQSQHKAGNKPSRRTLSAKCEVLTCASAAAITFLPWEGWDFQT